VKGPINPDRLIAAIRNLEIFVNDCLGLEPKTDKLSGFEYVFDLATAAVTNSYVETVAEHADSLHRAIKAVALDRVVDAYARRVKALGPRYGVGERDVILAFDHTHEDYYGRLDSTYLHAWTGEHAVTGHWKFLTCSIVNPEGPKVPLLSLPTPIGYDVSKQVDFILDRVRGPVKGILLTLWDRGFYTWPLLKKLDEKGVPYLVFAPKNEQVKRELEAMEPGESRIKTYEFSYAKDKTTHRGTTMQAFLKQVFDARNEKHYDWAFATNTDTVELDSIIKTYKQRWRIETGFRVQDEARIKTKSKEAAIRYFYHAFEQALQFTWGAQFKQDAPFKSFLLQLYETSKARVAREKTKQARRAGPGA